MTDERMTMDVILAEAPPIPWWWAVIEGVALIIVGILLLAEPQATIQAAVQVLGLYWLIGGIFNLVSLFYERTAWAWRLLSAILGIIAGVVILNNPLWAGILVPATLLIFLGILGIIIGVLDIIRSFPKRSWGGVVVGIVSIVIGLCLVFEPLATGSVFITIIGLLAVLGGIAALAAGFMQRRFQKDLEKAA
jgi:uncharacterized membrane protein HdeD (DUF308 family)